jgi:hypothetical protein
MPLEALEYGHVSEWVGTALSLQAQRNKVVTWLRGLSQLSDSPACRRSWLVEADMLVMVEERSKE